jgi:MFS family permease
VFKSGNSDGGVALVAYLLAMQVAVQVSGPYVVPFILAEQRLSYLSYMLLIGLAYFGKVIALPLWGRVAHQGGARRLLWIGGTSIIPMAALWLGVDLFPGSKLAYMAVAQIVSGFVWAAYELAMQLMFFEAIPRRDRPCMLTYYNFGNAAAQVAGCFIGAAILQLGGEGHTAYLTLFVVSSLLRLCTVPLLRQIQDQPPQLIEPIMPVEPRAAAPLHRAA